MPCVLYLNVNEGGHHINFLTYYLKEPLSADNKMWFFSLANGKGITAQNNIPLLAVCAV